MSVEKKLIVVKRYKPWGMFWTCVRCFVVKCWNLFWAAVGLRKKKEPVLRIVVPPFPPVTPPASQPIPEVVQQAAVQPATVTDEKEAQAEQPVNAIVVYKSPPNYSRLVTVFQAPVPARRVVDQPEDSPSDIPQGNVRANDNPQAKPTIVSGNTGFGVTVWISLGIILLVSIPFLMIATWIAYKAFNLAAAPDAHWALKVAMGAGMLVAIVCVGLLVYKVFKWLFPSSDQQATDPGSTDTPTVPARSEPTKGWFERGVENTKKAFKEHRFMYSLLVFPVWIIFMLWILLASEVLGWWGWFYTHPWLILLTPVGLFLFFAFWLVESVPIKIMTFVFFFLSLTSMWITAARGQEWLTQNAQVASNTSEYPSPGEIEATPNEWSCEVPTVTKFRLKWEYKTGRIEVMDIRQGSTSVVEMPVGRDRHLGELSAVRFRSLCGSNVKVHYWYEPR